LAVWRFSIYTKTVRPILNYLSQESCKKELTRLGAVHYIYQAARRFQSKPELHYVLFTIFIRFTNVCTYR
jgi:hypothetical protein